MKQGETPHKIRVDKRRRKDIKKEECAERNAGRVSSTPSASATETAITLPLVTGGEYLVFKGDAEQWQELYPAVDVFQELREMRGWLLGNPRNRKTSSSILRFIHGWLRREQDRTPAIRASPSSQSGLPTATTEWQYQKQQQRAMAASLLEARVMEREGSLSPTLEASRNRIIEQGAAHA